MAVSLKHTTEAVGTDAGNGEIRKAQWNEEHTLTLATARLLGRTTGGAGAVEEISAGTGLSLASGNLAVNAPNSMVVLSGPTSLGTGTTFVLSSIPSGYDEIMVYIKEASHDGGGTEWLRFEASDNGGSSYGSITRFSLGGTASQSEAVFLNFFPYTGGASRWWYSLPPLGFGDRITIGSIDTLRFSWSNSPNFDGGNITLYGVYR
jgi:hypothetical protein